MTTAPTMTDSTKELVNCRLDDVIHNYQVCAKKLHLVAEENSIPFPNSIANYQRAMNLAEVAYRIKTFLNLNLPTEKLNYRLHELARSATTVEGIRFVQEIQGTLNPLY